MKELFMSLSGATFMVGGIIGALGKQPVTEYMLLMIAGMIGIGFGCLIQEIKNR